MNALDTIMELKKALEAGNYNAAPSTLTQGASLQVEDLSTTMHNATFEDKHLKLQQMIKTESCKSLLAQFNRQLSYGIFGGSAQLEGNIGQEETSDFVRAVVPMCFYSHFRRVTIAANMVETFDGVKAEDRAAKDAALKMAGDLEFDSFRGMADFSNSGVFDGNPLATALLPNIHGLDLQIRQSDSQRNTRDAMFAEYGSDDTVVIAGGGVLTQDMVEDAALRSSLNFGNADKLVVDPRVLSAYNKLAFGKERIVLAGSPQEATGADLRKQWVSGGVVDIEASRFLSGKAKPAPYRNVSGAPTAVATLVASDTVAGSTNGGTSVTDSSAVTTFVVGEVYIYSVTSNNEIGESTKSPALTVTIETTGDKNLIVITNPSGTTRHYNVYRTVAGGAAGSEKFVGRVAIASTSTTTFTDLNNKIPGFVTGFLIQGDAMVMKELAPYSRLKMAVTDLSQPEGHFTFKTLAVTDPRKMCLVDNLR